MFLVTLMPEILLPTEGHPFITSNAAQWMAVEALFISRSKGLDLEDVFLGELSNYYRDWALSDSALGTNDTAKRHLVFLAETEQLRQTVNNPRNSILNVIANDIEPLRRVVEGVMAGGSKDAAFKAVSNVYNAADKYPAKLLADPELKDNLPKAIRGTSFDRLKKLWSAYADSLHYILIWHVGYKRAHSDRPLEPVPDASAVHRKMAPFITSSKRTKPISLPEPVILKFVSSREYALTKKDQVNQK